jgi:hypothetical protein
MIAWVARIGIPFATNHLMAENVGNYHFLDQSRLKDVRYIDMKRNTLRLPYQINDLPCGLSSIHAASPPGPRGTVTRRGGIMHYPVSGVNPGFPLPWK